MTTQRTSYAEDGEKSSSRRTISSLASVSTLHKAARACAKQGTPIFPCQPGGKAPLHGISIADASVDPEQIDAWWSAEPEANIGFCPGSLGVLVVDADPRKVGFDPELLARLRAEARRVQRTASGDPQHLFFLSETRHVGRVDLAPGFACYFDNEHVLLSPSRVGGTTYRMLQNSDTLSPFPAWAEEMRRTAGEGVQGLRQDWETASPEPGEPSEDDLEAELSTTAPTSLRVYNLRELFARKLKPAKYLMRPWLTERGTALISAFRGTGKTWTGFNVGMALAGGIPLLDWKPEIPEGIPVLYVDGEMLLVEVRDERLRLMLGKLSPVAQERILRNFHYLSHEDYEKGIPNLAELPGQQLIEAAAESTGAKVIALDNISCLFPSVAENDADAQAEVNAWLLHLRRRGYTVILIHHGGKPREDGRSTQRGSSRREDVITCSIMLNRLNGMAKNEFEWEFTKCRSWAPEAGQDRFNVRIGGNGWLEPTSQSETREQRNRTIQDLHAEGCWTQRQIGEKVGVSTATVNGVLRTAAGEAC